MLESVERFVVLDVTDKEIDAITAGFEGDPRAAIRALLHDLTALAVDSKAAVSRASFGDGYCRSAWATACRKRSDLRRQFDPSGLPPRCSAARREATP